MAICKSAYWTFPALSTCRKGEKIMQTYILFPLECLGPSLAHFLPVHAPECPGAVLQVCHPPSDHVERGECRKQGEVVVYQVRRADALLYVCKDGQCERQDMERNDKSSESDTEVKDGQASHRRAHGDQYGEEPVHEELVLQRHEVLNLPIVDDATGAGGDGQGETDERVVDKDRLEPDADGVDDKGEHGQDEEKTGVDGVVTGDIVGEGEDGEVDVEDELWRGGSLLVGGVTEHYCWCIR